MWQFTGNQRPSFAIPPKEGQESVWDYPRPPVCVDDPRHVVIKLGELVLADSHRAKRILETASPPTFYLPPSDIQTELLVRAPGRSFCEWKGAATYWSLSHPDQKLSKFSWSYEAPSQRFAEIKDYFSFYPALVDCFVDQERVNPQPGGFYGGWVTREIVGPFKGEPGTGGW